MLTTLAIQNYRSLRDLVLPLSQLTVIVGANGTGKSSLYRALRLLADAGRNGAVAALAGEGGLPSTLWAGPEKIGRAVREGRSPVQPVQRTTSVGLRLGYSGDEFGYALDFGLPVPSREPSPTAFNLDPEYKRECVWHGPVPHPSALLADRSGTRVRIRDESGSWVESGHSIGLTDSMLSEVADPRRCPELLIVRDRVRGWRFYDHFRTDADAPGRQSRIGTRTRALDHDGGDLAAALRTIQESTDADALTTAIDDAFPGSSVEIAVTDGRFDLLFHQHGLLRPLSAAELSDGTLRYLLWAAALLSPRPPELLVLNEPETSLHPDLLPALAALITAAAKKTQLLVVSHSQLLVRFLEDASVLELEKDFGATVVAGQGRLDQPAWHWPKR
ncbi:AAA family ATPase [Amycolatopsis rubida]|uniref:AAA family ATPase n=1 Tax=Amycolatopsis rubida TaxID=112413 RepID=A0ABX0BXW4_9PSEU|nr:AAA family ATPase [Amycolatopsis sp. M39]MYW95252.1 AAA family ATPase [Amycolatopsis rubida]NEC60241.1 AAA family ATPase [Amycolatopsis rubida]OAP28349.1 DNA replication and repair protein RecF [Amycolatopsis sp. M39]